MCVSLTGKGGSTVYLGESKRALHYFTSLGFRCGEHQNPTDFMLDVIGGEVPRAGQPDFRPQVCTSTPVRSFALTHTTHTRLFIYHLLILCWMWLLAWDSPVSHGDLRSYAFAFD